MSRRTVLAVAACVLTLVALAGCGRRGFVGVYVPASPAVTETTAPTPAPVAWGQSVALPGGITATTSQPQDYRPGEGASGQEGAERVVKVDVTLTNTSGRFLNFSDQLYPAQTIDGASTPGVTEYQISDESKPDVGSVPNDAVAPGKSATFSVAWPVTAAPATLGLDLQLTQQGYDVGASWSGTG